MRFLVTLALALFALVPCHAAPASAESVDALLSLIDMQKTYDASFAAMKKAMDASFEGNATLRSFTPEQRQGFDAHMARVMDMVRAEMDWSRLKPEVARMYMETFSQEEVDGLLAFYRTPTGQALLSKMPVLMSKLVELTQARLRELMPRVLQSATESMKDIAAH